MKEETDLHKSAKDKAAVKPPVWCFSSRGSSFLWVNLWTKPSLSSDPEGFGWSLRLRSWCRTHTDCLKCGGDISFQESLQTSLIWDDQTGKFVLFYYFTTGMRNCPVKQLWICLKPRTEQEKLKTDKDRAVKLSSAWWRVISSGNSAACWSHDVTAPQLWAAGLDK